MYDYLIVGAGLYGAVFAHEAQAHGKSVLVIDKRSNIAGNIYTENIVYRFQSNFDFDMFFQQKLAHYLHKWSDIVVLKITE